VLTVRIALWVIAATAALAFDFSALKPQGYLSDFAGVVDPASKADLERYCAQLERVAGVELALVTVPSLQGEPIEDVANLLHRKWGVGKKKTDEGALLLLAIRERRSRLEVGYGLEPILPDGAAGALLREMRPALRENHYGDALILAARAIGGRIEQAKGVKIEGAPSPRVRDRGGERGSPLGMIAVGGLVALALIFFARGGRGRGGRRRYASRYASPYGDSLWWLPLILSGGGGGGGRGGGWGSSHGGFGGYDSGDSFGGFGGGDSGGGGASGSW
jgi:uncharacterized protein